jgi:hypothetical protein
LPQIDIREGLFFLQTRADWLLGSQPGWALGAHLLIGLIYRQVRCPCLTLPQGIGEAEILWIGLQGPVQISSSLSEIEATKK